MRKQIHFAIVCKHFCHDQQSNQELAGQHDHLRNLMPAIHIYEDVKAGVSRFAIEEHSQLGRKELRRSLITPVQGQP
jgi:hypothetical protein